MNLMKVVTRITVQLLMIILIAFTVVMSFTACQKIEDPTRGVKLIVNYDILKTNISVRFYDASNGETIGMSGENQVSVQITGESASAVIDMTGESGKTYKSGGGFMTLFLNPNVEYTPSVENPIRFTIVATLDGYKPASQNVVISAEGEYFVEIAMVNESSPPEGMESVKEDELGSLVEGQLKQDVEVDLNTTASLLIPEGTIIKDDQGNFLRGYLNIEISYFDNLTDNTLAAFPGGLVTSLNNNGVVSDGVFYSAGYLEIVVTDKRGKRASTFEGNPVQLKMKLNQNTFNPETSSVVTDGDQMSVFSYHPLDGEWKYEQQTSATDENGNLYVMASLEHLSYWNFGWFSENSCDEGIELLFTGDQSGCECVNVQGVIRKSEDNTFLRYINIQACGDEPVTITNAPSGLPVYIEWETTDCNSYYVDPASNPLYINDLCASEQYTVNMLNESVQTTVVSVRVSARCVDYPDVVVHPSIGVWFRKSDSMCWRWSFMSNGEAEICDIELGQEYIIGAYYDNTWNEWPVVVNQSDYVMLDMELPESVCNTIFD